MLSYQHGYHAGNHADVLKHLVLVALLDHLLRKSKPLTYLETHSGAGLYDLSGPQASRNREFGTGIGRLEALPPEARSAAPAIVGRYLEQVRLAAPEGFYPGSPLLADSLLRPEDSLVLFEKHPREFQGLRENLAGRRRSRIEQADGPEGCVAAVPPASRRGLVLLDPSYEEKDEYDAIQSTLTKLQRRFATGVYALWYPVVERRRVERLCEKVTLAALPDAHRVELCVAPDSEAFGMTGSGLILLRPAYTLPGALQEALPWLADVLGAGAGSWRCERLTAE